MRSNWLTPGPEICPHRTLLLSIALYNSRFSGVSGAPTGSVVGNAGSAGGGGPGQPGQPGASGNFGQSDGGGDGFDGDGDKNEVESILLPNKHSWWNLLALCRKGFR